MPLRLFVGFEAGAAQVGVSRGGTAHRAIRLTFRLGPGFGAGPPAAYPVASICLLAYLLGGEASTHSGVLVP